MSSDVGRLLLLQDSEGLKMRFQQLYRERDLVIGHARTQLARFEPLEKHKLALQSLLERYQEALRGNKDKLSLYLKDIDEGYREVETDLMD